MINRELIRLKIVQIAYAYYQNDSKNLDDAEKELMYSLSKAYEMYNHLLHLLVAVHRVSELKYETALSKYNRLHEGEAPSRRFIDNKFISQLSVNKQLLDYQEAHRKDWVNEEDFVRSLYTKIAESELYANYMSKTETTYEEDRDLWRNIYRTFIMNNDALDSLLEEMSLYWNDDRNVVDSFVLKTIKRFDEQMGADQPLMPEYSDENDKMFASRLFRTAILNADLYRNLMASTSKNWDFNRLALMDIIIMQIALAEIVTFPNIPLQASFNEYIEIAKVYSTQRSGSYINGVLDAIVRRLRTAKRISK